MNSDQFDNLTRDLANSVSRRQFLKVLALGIASVIFPLPNLKTVPAAAAQTTCNQALPPHPVAPLRKNKLPSTMSCSEVDETKVTYRKWDSQECKFKEYEDPDAYGGITPVQFQVAPSDWFPKVKRHKDGWTARTAGAVKFSIFMQQKSYKLTWTPDCVSDRDACKAEYNRWQREIDAHEAQHFQDHISIFKKVTNHQICYDRVRSYRTKILYPSPGEAAKALEQEIQNEMDRILQCILDQVDRCESRFHSCTECNEKDPVCTASCKNCGIERLHCDNKCKSAAGLVALQAGECAMCCDSSNCETCDSVTGTCVSACRGECTHCEDGECVRSCTDDEVCCAGQCISTAEQQCCRSIRGEYICARQQTCCGLDSCCDAGSLCCPGDGAYSCIPIGNQNCGDCRGCGFGQECCIRSNGAIAGCCDVGRCHPERGCT